MKHVEDIRALILTLEKSAHFHALVIESPPGWAKSSSVESVLSELGTNFISLGSYATPLALYNSLSENPSAVFVLDDSSGLFSDSTGMAILKAASWSSAGSKNERQVCWRSASEKVRTPQFNFRGKLILIANSVPQSADVRAFLSRTLHLSLRFDASQIETMLREAATNAEYFAEFETAAKVADFLIAQVNAGCGDSVNLRTLQMGYELAKTNPDQWQHLLGTLLPKVPSMAVLNQIAESGLSIEQQWREFSRITGLSRRTFFYHRSRLGLTIQR